MVREGIIAARDLRQDQTEALLRGHQAFAFGQGQGGRDRHHRRVQLPLVIAREGNGFQEGFDFAGGKVRAFELVPFMAGTHAIGGTEGRHLCFGHQAGVIILVSLEGQAEALHRIGDENSGTRVVRPAFERLQQGRHVMAAQIGHQRRQFFVAAPGDQRAHRTLIAKIVIQPLAPGRAALEEQRGVKRVGAGIDPFAQAFAARFCKRLLQQGAIFEHHDLPAEGLEQCLQPGEQTFPGDRIQALAVVVDDPPDILDALLPAFEQGLEDVAFVHLGVADQGHHAALWRDSCAQPWAWT